MLLVFLALIPVLILQLFSRLARQLAEVRRLQFMTTDSWADKMQRRADGFEAEVSRLQAQIRGSEEV